MVPRGPPGEHRRVGGLDRHDAHARLALLERFPHPGDGSAGAHGTDEDVDGALCVFPDFDRRGSPMDLGVRGVSELVQHDRARDLLEQLRRSSDRVTHEDAGGEHDFRAEMSEQRYPFLRHRLRHGQDEPVTSDRRDERQPDARVAACGFDQGRPRS